MYPAGKWTSYLHKWTDCWRSLTCGRILKETWTLSFCNPRPGWFCVQFSCPQCIFFYINLTVGNAMTSTVYIYRISSIYLALPICWAKENPLSWGVLKRGSGTYSKRSAKDPERSVERVVVTENSVVGAFSLALSISSSWTPWHRGCLFSLHFKFFHGHISRVLQKESWKWPPLWRLVSWWHWLPDLSMNKAVLNQIALFIWF